MLNTEYPHVSELLGQRNPRFAFRSFQNRVNLDIIGICPHPADVFGRKPIEPISRDRSQLRSGRELLFSQPELIVISAIWWIYGSLGRKTAPNRIRLRSLSCDKRSPKHPYECARKR